MNSIDPKPDVSKFFWFFPFYLMEPKPHNIKILFALLKS